MYVHHTHTHTFTCVHTLSHIHTRVHIHPHTHTHIHTKLHAHSVQDQDNRGWGLYLRRGRKEAGKLFFLFSFERIGFLIEQTWPRSVAQFSKIEWKICEGIPYRQVMVEQGGSYTKWSHALKRCLSDVSLEREKRRLFDVSSHSLQISSDTISGQIKYRYYFGSNQISI